METVDPGKNFVLRIIHCTNFGRDLDSPMTPKKTDETPKQIIRNKKSQSVISLSHKLVCLFVCFFAEEGKVGLPVFDKSSK